MGMLLSSFFKIKYYDSIQEPTVGMYHKLKKGFDINSYQEYIDQQISQEKEKLKLLEARMAQLSENNNNNENENDTETTTKIIASSFDISNETNDTDNLDDVNQEIHSNSNTQNDDQLQNDNENDQETRHINNPST